MIKKIPWSFSALQTFETCPKKFWHLKIRKDVKDSRSSVGDYGEAAHKHFELRLLKGRALPMDLQHHEPKLARLAAAPGKGMPEQKLAINAQFQPTGFFDDDVWLRSIIDYAKIKKPVCLIVDHKFGKMKPDFDQVKLMVATFSCFEPEVERYTGAYYWAKNKKFTTIKIKKDEIPEIWNEFIERAAKIDMAKHHDDFPAKPNGLCKRYCPVRSCPYNGQ